MGKIVLDRKDAQSLKVDWFGNNVAFTCPCCGQVFVVSAFLREKGGERGVRHCPNPTCGRSRGVVVAGRKAKPRRGPKASLTWE